MCFQDTTYFSIDEENGKLYLFLKITDDEKKKLCEIKNYSKHGLTSTDHKISQLEPSTEELREAYELYKQKISSVNESSINKKVEEIAELLLSLAKDFGAVVVKATN